jgi:glycosyltransferase involved in cell wall biosynthesis
MRSAVSKPRVVAIMPGRNVARTVAQAFDAIPRDLVAETILVDNASKDGTASAAEKLGITVIRHETDRGYGGSLKTCLASALEAGADLILEFHPDNQYDGRFIPALIEAARQPDCGIVLGSRFLPPRAAREGGMPLYKYLSNRVLSHLNGWLLDLPLSEFHSGFRVYNSRFLERVPFRENSDDFVFSFEIIVQALRAGYRVGEIAAFSRYFAEASSNPFRGSLKYGIETLEVSLAYRAELLGLRKPPVPETLGTTDRPA